MFYKCCNKMDITMEPFRPSNFQGSVVAITAGTACGMTILINGHIPCNLAKL